jgi:hypothetical protein
MSSRRREVKEGQNNQRKIKEMKTQNSILIAIAFALAFALAPVTKAAISPQGGPTKEAASNQPNIPPPPLPEVSIHSAGNVIRGETGSFVLTINPPFPIAYVNFSVSGTAVAGVDYVPLVSPAYLRQPGYGVILLKTLPDPRASFNRQAYSVVVTLEPGPGYALGAARSATIWIEPSAISNW